MTIKKTLTSIVLAGTLALSGCGDKEVPKPIESIDGVVKKEVFYEAYTSLFDGSREQYHMVVEGSDGHTRSYVFYGDYAKRFDVMYDVGSKVNLPKEGINIMLLE